MANLLAILPSDSTRARLRCALRIDGAGRVRHRLVLTECWEEVHRLGSHAPLHLVVFDPFPSGRLHIEECAVFHDSFPSVPLLPYGDFSRAHARDLLRLAALGVREVVVRDEDDAPTSFHLLITGALMTSVVGEVLDDLSGIVPSHFVSLVRDLLFAAHRSLHPADVAKLYHRHPSTLREHLKAAGLPTVNKLIVWMRLFCAAHLLQDPGRSVENVALTLDFPSASALRNQLQRYSRATPQQVRAHGARQVLVAAFRDRHRSGQWEAGTSLQESN